MAENLGRDLALSDPMMQIGQWIANLGSSVQNAPQVVQDVLDSVKSGVNKAQTSVETAAKPIIDKAKQAITPDKPATVQAKQPGPFKTGRISTDDFANELKKKYPQLGKYNNVQIVNKILENRPDLVDKIDNPLAGDAAAAREQQRTLQQQQNQLAPAHAALSSLSGIGAILGSTAGLPGTMLGAGAGQGAQDFLENVLGISNTGGLTGAKNIGMSSLLAGVVPGAIEYASSPLKSTGALARAGSKLEDAFIPSKLRGWLKPPFLDYIANALEGEKGVDPLKAPMDRSPMFANEAELGAKPRFRINGNGTFTNTETGEVFDHAGNPIKATTPTQTAKPTSTSQSKFSLYGDKADIDKFIAQILAGK
jgi:hypothetical protein